MVDEREQYGNETNTDSSNQPRTTKAHEVASTIEDATQDHTKLKHEDTQVAYISATKSADGTTEAEDDGSREREDDDERSAEQRGPAETTEKAQERVKFERRRRRCPMVNIDQYSEGESKEGDARSVARMIMQGDVAGLMHLLRESGIISEADGHGWTPLHWACSRGSVVVTHILLQEIRAARAARAADEEAGGSNFNPGDYLNAAEDVNGWTPLHLAAVGEYLDVMYLLMEAGCNPNVKDKVGDRPIDCVKRPTARQGKRARRLRNALLDLSDSESSDDAETITNSRQRERRKQVVDSRPRAHRRTSNSGHTREEQRSK